MNLEDKREKLIASLNAVRERLRQLGELLAEAQRQEQQVIGAIMLVDELMGESKQSMGNNEQGMT